jgi:DNA polymerase-1
MNNKKKLILIDGYSFFFRAYFAMKSIKKRSDGMAVNGIYGFTRMLINLIIEIRSTHIAVVFDTGKKTFRHKLFEDYKANRPPVPEDMIPQFPLLREVSDTLNIVTVEKEGYEADDVIATLTKMAEKENYEVWIISSDKDLMQLVNDNVFLYETKESKKIGIEEVKNKWGVEPKKILDVLSLMGDSSDNIPGVPSIGEKTAVELVKEYDNIENLIKNISNIKQEKRRKALEENIDKLLLSKKLVTLCYDVELDVTIDDLVFKNFNPEKFITFLNRMEFYSIAKDVMEVFSIPKTALIKKSKNYEYKKITSIELLEKVCLDTIRHNDHTFFEITTENINEYNNIKTICFSDENKKYIFYIFTSSSYVTGDLFDENKNENELHLINVLDKMSCLFHEKNLLKISHNVKKQIRILRSYNINIENYDDIGVMSYLLDNGKITHNFSSIIRHYLFNNVEIKVNGIERDNFYIEQYEKDRNLSIISLPDIFNFSCLKIEIMGVLFNIINARLQENSDLKALYEKVEKPLIEILANMEFEGITIDIVELKNLSDYFYGELKNIEKEVYKEVGFEFNINSPKQLGEILFEKLNLPTVKKPTKSGNYSTDVDILEDLYNKGFDIAGKVLEYRHYMKLKNTYTDALPQLIDKNNRVHTTYSNIYVITGRLSSSNPNLQNIPIRTKDGEKIRRTFISKKGYSLIGADYSQIELRILAQYANVKKLIENFENNLDIHTETAKFVFKTNEVTPDMRRAAKAINFSIIYGTTSFGLAKRLDMSNRDAKAYIDNYFSIYPEVMEYMENTKKFAKKYGYVKTLFNRVCYINLNDVKEPQKSFLERLAINAPIQGTGADIIKMAMIAIDEKIREYDAKIILQIHDELLIEAKNECLEEVKTIVKNTMESIVEFKIPLPVEIVCGSNWSDVH